MSQTHSGQLRRSERLLVEIDVVLSHPRTVRRIAADLSDISAEGCRVVTQESLQRGDQLLILIEGLDPWPAHVVWVSFEGVGVEFHTPLAPELVGFLGHMFKPRPRADAPRAA